MREIYKTIQVDLGSGKQDVQLKKLDAFSGAVLLRHVLKLDKENPTVMDLVCSLEEEELKSAMRVCLSNVSAMLPAGPNPVMQMGEWNYPELEHDTMTCMRLMIEVISWSLSGFFVESGSDLPPVPPRTLPPNVPISTNSSSHQ